MYLESSNANLRSDPPRTRRPVPPPLYGAGVSPGPREGSPGPGTPGGGPRPRDRAPARGVDVKPPLREPGTGLPGPLRGPKRASGGLRDPGTGSGQPGAPEEPGSRTRYPARGWFYINPSRRGPVPGRDRQETPPGLRSRIPRNRGKSEKNPKNRASRASPGRTPKTPQNRGTGPRREGLM